MNPEVTREDIEREVAFLRANVDEYPALSLLLDHYDPDSIQLAARSAPSEAQSAALEARQALFRIQAGVANRLYAESEEIDLAEWLELMKAAVKDVHISAYIAGMNGAWSDMTAADWGRVGRTIRDQYAYLENWARELDSSAPSLAQMDARAALYGAAATKSFNDGRATRAGFDPAQLPAMPGDGTTQCRTNCRCYWRIVTLSKSRGDYNVSWRMRVAEHCTTCPKRQRSWRSLKIRGGVMVSEVAVIVAS